MKWYGWLGLAVMAVSEVALYSGVQLVATWFTPLMWTGYILLVDALVASWRGVSWLTTRRREFGFLALLSVLSWLLFEIYNFKLKNWVYIGTPPEPWARDMGFFWSFATITPALFETAELLHPLPAGAAYAKEPRGAWAGGLTLLGLALIAIPPALPDGIAPYTFAAVWLGFILLLDPINLRLGSPSMLREWMQGRRAVVWRWLLAGLICGLLWEAWNFQTLARGGAGWLYTMPQWIHDLVFGLHYGKMPLAGLLGFPPFALECFAIYYFLRWALQLER